MAKELLVLMHPAFEREETQVVVPVTAVDAAGYRSVAAMVATFRKAGIQLETFRAADFDGELEVNPLFANYIDPVDRDDALQDAIARAKQAREDFQVARRAAIDKMQKAREDEIERIAERLRRSREASQRPEVVPAPQGAPVAE